MKYHTFPAFSTAWPDVHPGDIIVVPETRFYSYDEYETRTDKTKFVIVQKNPLLVIARIDKWVEQETGVFPQWCSLFVVFSITRGFLITVMSRESNKQDGKLGT